MTSDRTATGLRLRLVLCLLGMAAAVSLGCSNGDASPVPVDGPAEQATASSPIPAAPTAAPTQTPVPTPTSTPPPAPTQTPLPSPTPSPVPQPVSWTDLLADSFDRMRAVDSLHFQVEIEIAVKSADASMTIPVSFEGDYQAPDRARGALKMSLGFFEVESETITIGNDAYFTNPETGLWEAGSLEDVPLVQPTDLLEVGSVPVKGLALAGRETIGGAPVYRLTGTIPAESVLGEGDTAGDLQIEYWITEEDSLIRRVALEGDLGAGDDVMFFGGSSPSPSSTTLKMTMTLSDFGSPVQIEAPQIGSPRTRQ